MGGVWRTIRTTDLDSQETDKHDSSGDELETKGKLPDDSSGLIVLADTNCIRLRVSRRGAGRKGTPYS